MILDIIFLLVVIGAFYAGFKQGIIYALISFVSIFIGVIAALNFSTFVGIYLIKNFNFPEFILPLLSYLVVFFVVIYSLKFVAFVMQKVLQKIALNGINKLAGGILFGLLGIFIFSVLFSFLNDYGIFTETLKTESHVYPLVSEIGPEVFTYFSEMIPMFNDIYQQTNDLFKEAAVNM